jgi:hypothetical protein
MPSAKKLDNYAPELFELLDKIERGLGVTSFFTTKREAKNTRAEFYKFRQVLRDMANTADKIEVNMSDDPSGDTVLNFKRRSTVYSHRLQDTRED